MPVVRVTQDSNTKYIPYNQNPAHFLFYENWESRELWQTHMNNQHLKDYMAATEGAVEEFTLNEMTKIVYTD